MNDDKKTKKQPIEELHKARQQVDLNESKGDPHRSAQGFEESDFWRLAVEHANEGIVIVSADKRLFFNRKYLELVGCNTPGELDEKPFLSTVHPDDRQRVRDIIGRRQSGKPAPSRYECKLLRPDASVIHVEISSSFITYRGQPASLGYVIDISDRRQAEKSLRESEAAQRSILLSSTPLDPANLAEGVTFTAIDNTEYKRMQAALQQSEGKYRGIFENAVEGLFQSTPEGRFISANPALARMCGYDSPEAMIEYVTDMTIQHYVHPEEREIFKRIMAERGYVANFEHKSFRRDGSIFWVSVNARVVRDSDGSILFYEGSHQDITERKQAEEALQESEERYRTILEEIEDGYQEVDLHGNFTFFNESFRRIFGYGRDELMGRNYRIFAADEENVKKTYRAYNQMYRTGMPIRGFVWDIIRKDGEKRSVEFFASVLRDSEGRPKGFRGIVRDITDRMHAEELYWTVANSSQAGVYIIQDGGFCFVNPHISRYSGYSEEELIGAKSLNFVHPDDREMVREKSRNMLKGGMASPYEYRILEKNGHIKWLMETVTAITYRGKQAILGNTMDITEQKELEADRRRLESQLLQAQKMEAVGTLAGGIAHDFNNLLMGIQGYASLMLLNINPSHPHYEKLRRIEEQVQSGADLTKQLLGFARGGRYEIKPANLNEVIKRTSGLFGRTKREITIHSKFERRPWSVEVDQGQIEQVLLNLYVNAWQAMPGGGEIYLETENVHLDENVTTAFSVTPGRYVKVSITDTGIGMDEKTKERIFEPFFTTKEMGRGTGLGLAMVYGIIKGHKGIINVYSEKGHGTTFSIYLPASHKEVIKEDKSSGEIQVGHETILVVDDEKIITEVTREMLEGLGYQVLIAQSGHDAIEIYRANREKIDLVIVDMIMPGMSGGETFDMIKSINPDVKVILSSGYSINDQAATIMGRGVHSFLQKPFRMKDLSQKVRGAIGE